MSSYLDTLDACVVSKCLNLIDTPSTLRHFAEMLMDTAAISIVGRELPLFRSRYSAFITNVASIEDRADFSKCCQVAVNEALRTAYPVSTTSPSSVFAPNRSRRGDSYKAVSAAARLAPTSCERVGIYIIFTSDCTTPIPR